MCITNSIELILFEIPLTSTVQSIDFSEYSHSIVNTYESEQYLFDRLDYKNCKGAWFQSRTRTRIIGCLLRCGSKFCSG